MSDCKNRNAPRSPCGNCPYRKDSPRGLWHPDEFKKLVASDRAVLGSLFLCHKQTGHVCVGWLLNQRERNLPSLALRLALISGRAEAGELAEILRSASDGGHELFESIEDMCSANGVDAGDRPEPERDVREVAARLNAELGSGRSD